MNNSMIRSIKLHQDSLGSPRVFYNGKSKTVCIYLSVLSVCLTPSLQRLRTYAIFFRNGSQRLTPIPRAAGIDIQAVWANFRLQQSPAP